MKILHIASADFAGVGIKLVRAINRYSDHQARLVTGRSHSLGFPTDIVARRDVRVVKKWVKWADVVHTYNHFGMLQRAGFGPKQKRYVITHHGSDYRRSWKAHNRRDKRWGAFQLCTTPDLTRYGATWLPTAIPVEPYLKMARRAKKGKPPIVCQAPTNFARKSTLRVAELVKKTPGVQWRCIVKKKHPECLRLKARAFIGIDQFGLGLGVNGYEFMAMGIPVLAHANPKAEGAIRGAVGELPYVDTTLKGLRRTILGLLKHQDVYDERVERGLAYVRQFHARPVVVDRYLKICESL
jgi:glycosyltransferase involved in cell wall biosynthesis